MRKARIFAFKNSSLLVGLIFSLSASTHMLNSIAATQDKTLVYCFEARPTGFSANQAISIPEQTASSILYNRLVEFERGGTMLEPGLAESWDIPSTTRRKISQYALVQASANSTPRMCSSLLNGCAIPICRSVKPVQLMKIYKFNWTGFTERHIGIAHPFKSEEHILGVEFACRLKPRRSMEFHATA